MKVIFCTDGIFPHATGGMQRHSRLLVQELAAAGNIELIVLHPHAQQVFDPHPCITEVKLTGIDTAKNYLRQCYAYSRRVYAEIVKHPGAIVYAQGLSVWYNIARIPNQIIVNPHGLEPFQAIGLKDKMVSLPFKLVFNHIFRHADVVVSLGGKLTGILKQQVNDKSKIQVIPNAVNIPAPLQKDFSVAPLHFLFVARFAHNKGIHILMEAITSLKEKNKLTGCEFTLAGTGPLYETYKQQDLPPGVKLTGFINDSDLFDLYRKAHCFVFPTLFEGMPTVILEAMANSTPVIASDTGAISEQVNPANGYLIARNNTDALVKALESFIALSPAQKSALAAASYAKARDHFSWPVVAQRYHQLFTTLAHA